MRYLLPPVLRYALAAAYAYGAAVHVANMIGLSGFDWIEAPLKWQVLDVVYLVLDVIVVCGLIFQSRLGLIAFTVASISQIALYTVFRDWVLDVPSTFVPTVEQQAYLWKLVVFHFICLTLVIIALLRDRNRVVVIVVIPFILSAPQPVDADPMLLSGLWSSPGLSMVVVFEACPNDRTARCGRFVWSWDGDDELEHKYNSLVVQNVRANGNHWRGSLIDPSNGRRYRGTLKRIDEQTLELEGCYGPFCQQQTWRSLNSTIDHLLNVRKRES